jgi:hypothetical protein
VRMCVKFSLDTKLRVSTESPSCAVALSSMDSSFGSLSETINESLGDFAPTEKPDVMTSEWPTNHDLTGGVLIGILHYRIGQ